MKKVVNIFLIFSIIFASIMVPETSVNAQTLGDIKKELQKYEEDYKANKLEKQLTNEQIASTKQRITSINRQIDQIGIDIIKLNDDIEKLNASIALKEEEIKKIVNFVQVSNGESAYLEYAFGAQDFTDFIYRVAIAEQLAKYNEKLIKDFNDSIIENNNNKAQLANKKVTLRNNQIDLAGLLQNLNTKVLELDEYTVSIEEEIRLRKEAVNLYEKQLGCKDNEDIRTCGRNVLPVDTAFYRPLIKGYVTSNYGWYDPWNTGNYSFHYGLDLSTTDSNTPVYSSAAGLVVGISRNQSCGKNIVYITHNVKGETYTTAYWHLRSVSSNISVGTRVTKDTQIGIMGGASYDNDSCSTGPHLHFVTATGLLYTDYHTISALNARRFNPRIVLNAPPEGGYFKDRITKY